MTNKFLQFNKEELEALQYFVAYTGTTGNSRRDRMRGFMLEDIKEARKNKD